MKKVVVFVLAGLISLLFSGVSFGAGTYNYFTQALTYLSHDNAYVWAIDLDKGGEYDFNKSKEIISSMTLTFENIVDDTNDGTFHVNVVNSNNVSGTGIISEPYMGVDSGDLSTDNYFTTDFIGDADRLFTINNVDNRNNHVTVTYEEGQQAVSLIYDYWNNVTVDQANTNSSEVLSLLSSKINQDVLALGFDPDCHFSINSVSLSLTTRDLPPGGTSGVPEPQTLLLFGLGLLGIGAVGRKRMDWEEKNNS